MAKQMNITIDTSALVAVIAGETERDRIIEQTYNKTLLGPGSIPWEIGNAFSAMFRRKRITLKEAQKAITIFLSIPSIISKQISPTLSSYQNL